MNADNKKKNISYSDTGVDISEGKNFVENIKAFAKRTLNERVLTGIGPFGGLFSLKGLSMKEPVLVSSTDGVGTKIKVAVAMSNHKDIGKDIVSHCINDIMVQGALPLFFLDYIGCGKLSQDILLQIIDGISEVCQSAGCALLGGETAEMPDVYKQGEYDLVGTIIGVVDKDNIIDGSRIKESDILIGLPSSGLHTNGYTLARKIVFDIKKFQPDDMVDELGCSIGSALLTPHKCYYSVLKTLFHKHKLNGIAHITGGGVIENVPRVLPEGLSVEISKKAMPVPKLFSLLQEWGPVDKTEMYRVFNMGIGLVIIVSKETAQDVLEQIKEFHPEAAVIGQVITGRQETRLID